jgi:hypothetical protein
MPMRPGGLEHGGLAAARVIGSWPNEVPARLLIGKAVGRVGMQPARVRKRQAAEREVVRRLRVGIASGRGRVRHGLRWVAASWLDAVRPAGRRASKTGAAHRDQQLQLRQLDVGRAHVLPGQRDVVERASGRVLVPFPRRIEERVIVLDVDGALPIGALNRIISPGVFVPGRLLHGDRAARNALNRRVPIRPRSDDVQLGARRLGQVVQEA